jgi:hypothetical protein
MLLINQCLDKLKAMHSDFVFHGMLPAGHIPSSSVSFHPPKNNGPPASGDRNGSNHDNSSGELVDENVLGHVVLAHSRSEYCSVYLCYLCEFGINIIY